jgi:DNA-binding GntR family transcriptional regulator
MKFEKIPAKTLRQRVFEQLRDKIISAEILPGEIMTLRDLAEKFDVSLMPVREAVWQLESQKVIVVQSNKSVRVNELTGEQMEEALRLRILLETMAAERSCRLRPDSAVPAVQALLEGMKNAAGKRPKIYMRKNTEFHFAIYSYSRSPLLLEIVGWLWARVGPYVYRDAVKKRDVGYAMKCHQEMFEGFAERDQQKLADALRRDLEAAAQTIIPSLARPATAP